MADIIIFAIIAALLLWKLKSILGQEDEDSKNRIKTRFMSRQVKDVSEAAPTPKNDSGFLTRALPLKALSKQEKPEDAEPLIKENLELIPYELHEGYRAIAATFPSGVFALRPFMSGVETVIIEMIEAMNNKNVINLTSVCSNEMILKLEKMVKNLKEVNPKQIIQFVRIVNIKFVEFKQEGFWSHVKVEVKSEQLRYSKEGEEVKEGSINVPGTFTDVFEFQRNSKLGTSSWNLIDIK